MNDSYDSHVQRATLPKRARKTRYRTLEFDQGKDIEILVCAIAEAHVVALGAFLPPTNREKIITNSRTSMLFWYFGRSSTFTPA